MFNKYKRFLPAYVNLSPLDLVARREARWKNFFPFDSANGLWTFSGRVALKAGLDRMKFPLGSTIMVPSYFQGTEIDTLLACGFKLRFYRVDTDFRVDLEDVEKRLDSSVAALYIIHYFGLPQPLTPIETLCKANGIALIEDCALSLFSKYEDQWLGSRGDFALFSVYKTVPLPHGGYLVSKKRANADMLKKPPAGSTMLQTADLVAQWMRGTMSSRTVDSLWNMTTRSRNAIASKTVVSGTITLDPAVFQYAASPTAVRLMNLVDPTEVIRKRRENFNHLHHLLEGVARPVITHLPDGACPLFYPIMIGDKRAFRDELAKQGVGSVNLWSRRHPACPDSFEAQVSLWRERILELPIHQQLDSDDIKLIGETVSGLIRRRILTSPFKTEEASPVSTAAPGLARAS